MTLRDLINKLLGRETASANTARERLQGEDVQVIDPNKTNKSLKDKFIKLMQTKIF